MKRVARRRRCVAMRRAALLVCALCACALPVEVTDSGRKRYPRRSEGEDVAIMPPADLRPHRRPQTALVLHGLLDFSFSLMTDDWSAASDSRTFRLGQMMNLQASVKLYGHAHLRLFVDHCVATPGTGGGLDSRYTIVDDFGCLVDSQVSSSGFLATPSDSVVRLRIQTFRFTHQTSDQVADADKSPYDLAKSCNYNTHTERWEELDGEEDVCRCCKTLSCGRSKRHSRHAPLVQSDAGEVVIGPLSILPEEGDRSLTH
ncbi:zona pellucida sperm-binding protein 3-like isoform X2 [Denticeps clupeoides]|uniref:zona pellucida sperm-binding protein 3-like isoform X2 n=1 Tax=Denticeps clupeoides TaxID=299321 RepID=UPI0010A3AA53|nr:zona pellucida sperm-binding protein 3-like isoform X2 [Denticeps clupeoides]